MLDGERRERVGSGGAPRGNLPSPAHNNPAPPLARTCFPRSLLHLFHSFSQPQQIPRRIVESCKYTDREMRCGFFGEAGRGRDCEAQRPRAAATAKRGRRGGMRRRRQALRALARVSLPSQITKSERKQHHPARLARGVTTSKTTRATGGGKRGGPEKKSSLFVVRRRAAAAFAPLSFSTRRRARVRARATREGFPTPRRHGGAGVVAARALGRAARVRTRRRRSSSSSSNSAAVASPEPSRAAALSAPSARSPSRSLGDA
jgi:hypothetical protein